MIFGNKMEAWLLAEASETMKLYASKYCADSYTKTIKSYETPQKYIKDGDDIYIISFTSEIWGGIDRYRKNNIIFEPVSNGRIRIIRAIDRAETLIKIGDYPNLFKKMLATKYVNTRDLKKCKDSVFLDSLPRAVIVNSTELLMERLRNQ